MIRINLLKDRREPVDGLEAAIAATGPSAFINRREIVLGALFLALGGGILYLNAVAAGSAEAEFPVVASASDEIAPAPAPQPLVRAEPTPRQAAALPEPAPAPEIIRKPAIAGAPAAPREGRQTPREAARETSAVAHAAALPAREPIAIRSAPKPATPPVAASDTPLAPKPAAALVPGQLSSLEISRRGATLNILATIGEQPAYQMFRLNSPNRVVVDLSGVTLSLPASLRQITLSDPLVERIRIAQFQVSPPKVRLVFDVSRFPEVSIKPAPAGLSFQVAAPAP